jgi:predicted nucleotidyltransferase component of viral defense system
MAAALRAFGVRVAEVVRRDGVPHDTVLKDHALTYILAGIASVPDLAEGMAFKGGTALRKCYFPNYRYSEDLDFSADGRIWDEPTLTPLLAAACEAARRLTHDYGPFEFAPALVIHRSEHEHGQLNYSIRVRFPSNADLGIKFELTMVEPLLFPRHQLHILHAFAGEEITATIRTYSLDEVVAEKLRAFLQTRVNLARRDWTNRSRDLYDLWYLHSKHPESVAWDHLLDQLAIKAEARGISFTGPNDFRDPRVLRAYEHQWDAPLRNFVIELPSFVEARAELDMILAKVFVAS